MRVYRPFKKFSPPSAAKIFAWGGGKQYIRILPGGGWIFRGLGGGGGEKTDSFSNLTKVDIIDH